MTPRYPGAVWMPRGSDQGPNNGPVAFSWHEAVTTGSKEAIGGWVDQSNACHAFIGQYGDMGQYKDFDRVAYGVLNGNQRGVVTIETWDNLLAGTERTPDGRHGSNDYDWDEQQCERIADVIAWANVALGIPIEFMRTTRDHGHGPHRLGVPEASGSVNVGYGPDKWTSHPGKSCPGDLRVICLRDRAIPRARVIAAAVRAGRCTWLPQGRVNLAAALARTGGVAHTGTDTPTTTTPKDDSLSAADVAELKKYIDAKFDAYSQVNGESYPVTAMLAFIDFNVNRAVDAATATANKVGATVPARKAVGRKPKPAPAKPAPPVVKPPAPAKPTSHKVAQGESLSTIAAKYGTTWQALAQLNKLSNPDVVNPGDVLQLPK